MTTDPSPAPDTPRPEYEFTPAQSRTLEQLAGNLLFAGWFIAIAVVVFHLVLVLRWAVEGVPMYDRFRLSYVLWPILLLVGSWQFIVTGLAFRRVARTEGSDIAHLMMALEGLNVAFVWLTIVPKVWLILLPIALLVGGIAALIHWLGY